MFQQIILYVLYVAKKRQLLLLILNYYYIKSKESYLPSSPRQADRASKGLVNWTKAQPCTMHMFVLCTVVYTIQNSDKRNTTQRQYCTYLSYSASSLFTIDASRLASQFFFWQCTSNFPTGQHIFRRLYKFFDTSSLISNKKR